MNEHMASVLLSTLGTCLASTRNRAVRPFVFVVPFETTFLQTEQAHQTQFPLQTSCYPHRKLWYCNHLTSNHYRVLNVYQLVHTISLGHGLRVVHNCGNAPFCHTVGHPHVCFTIKRLRLSQVALKPHVRTMRSCFLSELAQNSNCFFTMVRK